MKAGMRWIVMVVAFGMVPLFGMPEVSLAQSPETLVCLNCHRSWLDNNPVKGDVSLKKAHPDYVPLNLADPPRINPFYTIAEGYLSSGHGAGDFPTCQGCHGNQLEVHGGPGAIPGTQTCLSCHASPDPVTGLDPFLATGHGNPNNLPDKFFDQPGRGKKARAFGVLPTGESIALMKSNKKGVTQSQRIEECSACHNYALSHPQLAKKIAQGKSPDPQVGCPACHQAHGPGPAGDQLAVVDSTVQVTGASSTTVTAVTPVTGPPVPPEIYPRSVNYPNHRPFKADDTGAQNFAGGTWTRGSAIARPSTIILSGKGTIRDSAAGKVSDLLTITGIDSGSLANVKQGHTLFLTSPAGTFSGTATLPADAINAGAGVTVAANLDNAGFHVEHVDVAGQTILLRTRTNANFGSDEIAVVAGASVTYMLQTFPGPANKPLYTRSKAVFVDFKNPEGSLFTFEVRDMYINTEALCAGCHTQGKLKFTAFGKKADGTTVTDAGKTHNKDIYGQYMQSGHRHREAPPWEEFSAFEFQGHQVIYPFDMSISGSGGVGSKRNKGNMTYNLTTPNATNAYLSRAGVTSAPQSLNANYACYQCHNGLGSINYQKNVQGTPAASVMWGDSTVTCITCHEPHSDPGKTGKNIRKPEQLSFNSNLPGGGFNKFLDGTPIPDNVGDGLICLFCHQGRESGLTVYMRMVPATARCPSTTSTGANGPVVSKVDPYTNPNDPICYFTSFANPHYLEGGAILWGRNAWEFRGSQLQGNRTGMYTEGNPMHQALNCMGCHMGEASPDNAEGGHTWKPRLETCLNCHVQSPPVTKFEDINYGGNADYDGVNGAEPISKEIGKLEFDNGVPDGPGNLTGGYGLLKQLADALAAEGIYYRVPNPYFFTAPDGSTLPGEGSPNFGATGNQGYWTANTLAAAFNLQYCNKAKGGVYFHNAKYVVQILRDSIEAVTGVTPAGVRPVTDSDRPATDYKAIADLFPPTVSITAPAAGATISGAVSVTASASDPGALLGVAGVQFRVDGENVGAEDTTSPFSISLNTTTLTNGTHTLTAVARDAAGITTTSAGVTVTVSN